MLHEWRKNHLLFFKSWVVNLENIFACGGLQVVITKGDTPCPDGLRIKSLFRYIAVVSAPQVAAIRK